MIKANESLDSNVVLYTGVAPVTVIGINPDKTELEVLGYKPKDEPKYIQDDGGCRIDVYVKESTTGAKAKVVFWLKEGKKSNTGKFRAIDKFGKTTWLAVDSTDNLVNPNMDWFDFDSARKCYDGEENLSQFIQCLANVKKGEEGRLDNVSLLVQGNVQELHDIAASVPNNKVKVCFAIQNEKYQGVYGKAFQRGWAKDNDYIAKAIGGDDYNKLDCGNPPYNFKVWNGQPTMKNVPATAASTGDDAPADDLPF